MLLAQLLTETRLDVLDPLTQIGELVSDGLKRRKLCCGRGFARTAPKRDLAEMILWESKSARDRGQGRAGALPVNALLDLTEGGRGDPRFLCKLPLVDLSAVHPVVDHLRHRSPVAQSVLLTRV